MTEKKRYYPVLEDYLPAALEFWGISLEEMKRRHAEKPSRTWTISTDPNEAGWDTDNGHQSDGGLTYEEAKFLADAANEKLERGGHLASERTHDRRRA